MTASIGSVYNSNQQLPVCQKDILLFIANLDKLR